MYRFWCFRFFRKRFLSDASERRGYLPLPRIIVCFPNYQLHCIVQEVDETLLPLPLAFSTIKKVLKGAIVGLIVAHKLICRESFVHFEKLWIECYKFNFMNSMLWFTFVCICVLYVCTFGKSKIHDFLWEIWGQSINQLLIQSRYVQNVNEALKILITFIYAPTL